MPTEVVKIVDPDNGPGTHYTSLSAWEAGEQRNLVTADEIAVAKCRCTGGSADTAQAPIAGWTTSEDCYIKIWTDPSDTGGDGQGGSYRHLGKWQNSGKVYRLYRSSNWTSCLSYGNGSNIHLYIDGIQFGVAGANSIAIDYTANLAGYTARVRFTNCIFINTNTSPHSGEAYAVVRNPQYSSTSGTDHKIQFDNCIFIRPVATGYLIHASVNASYQKLYFYNCTFVGGNYAFYRVCTSLYANYVRNCLFHGQGTALDSAGNFPSSHASYCACSLNGTDLDSITGGRKNQTFSFVDSSNHDYHLTSTDTGAKDYGTNLSSNPDGAPWTPLSTDIDGQSRGTSNWDIGADEYAAASNTYSQSLSGGFPAASGGPYKKIFLHPLGSTPYQTGNIYKYTRTTLHGNHPYAFGIISKKTTKPLTGTTPSSTGSVTSKSILTLLLQGSLPGAAGTLAAKLSLSLSLAGSLPSAAGAILKKIQKTLTGAAEASFGSIQKTTKRTLYGAPDSSYGAATTSYRTKQAASGTAPGPSGTLTALLNPIITFVKRLTDWFFELF